MLCKCSIAMSCFPVLCGYHRKYNDFLGMQYLFGGYSLFYLPSVICWLLSVICTGFFPEVLQLASFPALAHWCVDARLDIYTSHVTQYLSIHDIGLWRGRMRKIRQNNRLTFQPADSILLLDRVEPDKHQHQCDGICDCKSENIGEEQGKCDAHYFPGDSSSCGIPERISDFLF